MFSYCETKRTPNLQSNTIYQRKTTLPKFLLVSNLIEYWINFWKKTRKYFILTNRNFKEKYLGNSVASLFKIHTFLRINLRMLHREYVHIQTHTHTQRRNAVTKIFILMRTKAASIIAFILPQLLRQGLPYSSLTRTWYLLSDAKESELNDFYRKKKNSLLGLFGVFIQPSLKLYEP